LIIYFSLVNFFVSTVFYCKNLSFSFISHCTFAYLIIAGPVPLFVTAYSKLLSELKLLKISSLGQTEALAYLRSVEAE